jgi:SAM-dependent methyltransferase
MIAVVERAKISKIAKVTLVTVFLGLFASNCALSLASDSRGSGAVRVSETDFGKGQKLDVPYEPTTYEIAQEMIRMADVRKDDLVYDLGCGDGRIVIMAAKERGAKGVGVDLDPQRIKESVENARKAGVTDRVRFLRQDLFETNFKDATVMMIYLWPEVNLRLRPKLLADLKPGTRVVSHSHTMGDWKPDRKSEMSGHNLYFWVIPANVTGTWTWLMPSENGGTSPAILQVSQHYQEVQGSLLVGGSLISISDVALTGDHLRLAVDVLTGGQKKIFLFDGHVQGDNLVGSQDISDSRAANKYPWEAKRNPSSKTTIEK